MRQNHPTPSRICSRDLRQRHAKPDLNILSVCCCSNAKLPENGSRQSRQRIPPARSYAVFAIVKTKKDGTIASHLCLRMRSLRSCEDDFRVEAQNYRMDCF